MKTILILFLLVPLFNVYAQTLNEFQYEIEGLYQKQKFQEGVDLCDKAMEKYDISSELFYLKALGMVLIDGGFIEYEFHSDSVRYQEILIQINKSIAYDSTSIKSIAFRGHLNYKYLHFEEALVDYQKALELSYTKAKKARYHTFIMTTYLYMGDTISALSEGQKVTNLLPGDPDAMLNVGTVFIKFKMYKDAENVLLQAYRNDPENPAIIANLGYVCLLSGQYEKAIGYYDQAHEIDKKDFYIYSNRGYCYVMLGEYKKGLKDINQSLKINDRNPFAYKYRAIYYIKTGDIPSACLDLHKALDLGYATWDDEVDLLLNEYCK